MTRHEWTDDEMGFLKSFIPGHTERETKEAFAARFGWEMTKGQLLNMRNKLGVRHGTHGGRFVKGQTSRNKGKKLHEFMSPEGIERSKAARFKKGNVPHNGRAFSIGDERLDAYGYTEVKVKDLSGEDRSCWARKHVVVWEKANGRPVPKGHKVVFADGDKGNFDPENLVLVSDADWVCLSAQRRAFTDRETLEARLNEVRLRRAIWNAKKRKKGLCM